MTLTAVGQSRARSNVQTRSSVLFSLLVYFLWYNTLGKVQIQMDHNGETGWQ
jgi:hypothetical protein